MSQEPLQNYYSLDQALFRVESEEIKLLEGFSNKKATNKSHNLFFKFLCTSFHLYFYMVIVKKQVTSPNFVTWPLTSCWSRHDRREFHNFPAKGADVHFTFRDY